MVRYRVKASIGRLHVITTDDDGSRPSRSHAELAHRAIEGGADTIQYRSKSRDIRRLIDEARSVRRVCRLHEVTFIVNDRVDLCQAVDADGVHLGKEDMPVDTARRILGTSKLIGATIRGAEDLARVQEASADCAGLGPIFPSGTKEFTFEPLGVATIRSVVSNARIPVIAVAGITEENVGAVIEAGAAGAAVVGAVCGAEDPVEAARRLRKRIDARIARHH